MHVRVTQVVPLFTGHLSILPYVPWAGSSETRHEVAGTSILYVANSTGQPNRFLTAATVQLKILTVVLVLGRVKRALLQYMAVQGRWKVGSTCTWLGLACETSVHRAATLVNS